ncbi:hypothetical protein FOZ63_022197, partial [Perkinsus olseni]
IDGSRVVSVAADGLRIWDVFSGQTIKQVSTAQLSLQPPCGLTMLSRVDLMRHSTGFVAPRFQALQRVLTPVDDLEALPLASRKVEPKKPVSIGDVFEIDLQRERQQSPVSCLTYGLLEDVFASPACDESVAKANQMVSPPVPLTCHPTGEFLAKSDSGDVSRCAIGPLSSTIAVERITQRVRRTSLLNAQRDKWQNVAFTLYKEDGSRSSTAQGAPALAESAVAVPSAVMEPAVEAPKEPETAPPKATKKGTSKPIVKRPAEVSRPKRKAASKSTKKKRV